jgi:hypothetical protein
METTFGERTDNGKKERVISDYNEMRTEGTSRPFVGRLSRLLRMETKDLSPLQSVRVQHSEARL